MMLNITVVRPIPSASADTPAATSPRLRRNDRSPYRTSRPIAPAAQTRPASPRSRRVVERSVVQLRQEPCARRAGADAGRQLVVLCFEVLRDLLDQLGFVLRMELR